MNVQVIQYQVDCLSFRICHRQGDRNLSELEARTIRCHESEMAARLRFYSTENIGGPAPLIFVVPSRLSSWNRWRSGPQVGVQSDRLLVYAEHRLLRVIRPFVHLQDVFHLGDILIIQVGYHPHFFPATASGRGSTGESEWSLFLPAAPTCV